MIYLYAALAASAFMALYRRPPSTTSPLNHPSLPQRPTGGDHTAAAVGLLGSFAILALMSGFRHGPGTDYFARYVPIFERVRLGVPYETEYGYLAINRAVAAVTSDYAWVFIVTSALTVALIFRFIVRMSLNPALSVYIYAVGGTYLESFNLVRQGLAIAILVNTIELVDRRKPLPFVVLTLLASSLHSSALLWLAVWPLMRLRGGGLTRLGLLGGLILLILAAPSTLTIVVERFAPEYSWYFESNYGDVRAFDSSVLIIASIILAGSLLLLRGDKGEARESFYIPGIMNLQIVQVATLVATVTVAYAFSRLTYYFTPVQIIAVPLLLAAIPDRSVRRLATIVLMLAYGLAFYYRFVEFNAHGVLPYESILSR